MACSPLAHGSDSEVFVLLPQIFESVQSGCHSVILSQAQACGALGTHVVMSSTSVFRVTAIFSEYLCFHARGPLTFVDVGLAWWLLVAG